MKKTFMTLIALFAFTLSNAQLQTQSNYDVNGNGKVTVEDVTSTVNKVLGKASDDRTLVDGESLNALLQSIDARLKAIEEKLGIAPDAVDLGLPSGVKWASCNVGARRPEEYGDYFAWGETEPYYTLGHSQDNPCTRWKTNKNGYNWESYKWCNGSSNGQTKYCTSPSYGTVDDKKVLDLEDDAAHVNWGGDWRMPTLKEVSELCKECTWTWGSKSGVNGYTVVGPNGNSIFLPMAGYRYYSALNDVGSYGIYWSSSLVSNESDQSYYLLFDSSLSSPSYYSRFYGVPVRPVCQ